MGFNKVLFFVLFTLGFSFSFSLFSLDLFAQSGKPKPHINKRQSKKDQRLLKELVEELNTLYFDEAHNNTFWGVHIESLDPKFGVLYALNNEKNFVPASNQKLLTSSAALHYLDTSFHYQTSVHTWGTTQTAENGAKRLDGDLIFVSNGNPYHSERWKDSTKGDFFVQVADSLIANGITLINGDLVADDSFYEASTTSKNWNGGDGDYPSDWAWDDLSFAMTAPSSALAFNENNATVKVYPSDSVGKRPEIRIEPDLPYFTIENNATTAYKETKRSLEVTRRLSSNTIVISGSIAIDDRGFKERIAVEKPSMYFLTAAQNVLTQKGISISGKLRRKTYLDFYKSDTLQTIAIQYSPSLSTTLSEMNKASNNFFAEQLLHNIGYAYRKEGSTAAGLDAVKIHLNALGITEKHFYFVDGCGLSRKNRVAPSAIARILKKNSSAHTFEVLYRSLAIAGKDGTLMNRLKTSRAKEMCFAKTGFVGGVRTLSGYFFGEDDEWIIFSIMAMNFTQPRRTIEEVQDKTIDLLAEWTSERAK